MNNWLKVILGRLAELEKAPASRKPQDALGARIVLDDSEVKSDEISPQAQAEAT